MLGIHPVFTTFHRGAQWENLRSGYINVWAFCADGFLITVISHEASCDFRSYWYQHWELFHIFFSNFLQENQSKGIGFTVGVFFLIWNRKWKIVTCRSDKKMVKVGAATA